MDSATAEKEENFQYSSTRGEKAEEDEEKGAAKEKSVGFSTTEEEVDFASKEKVDFASNQKEKRFIFSKEEVSCEEKEA